MKGIWPANTSASKPLGTAVVNVHKLWVGYSQKYHMGRKFWPVLWGRSW